MLSAAIAEEAPGPQSDLETEDKEEEEKPASEKYGNDPLTITPTSAVVRKGISATLTCEFG